MSILLLGKNGQVGLELQHTLPLLGPVHALDVPEVDFTKPEALRQIVQEQTPSLIVNAAAYTAVDKAESEPELARSINATAPGVLAEEAKRLGIPLIHYSTDYVYDGTGKNPYHEESAKGPLGVYGQTKLEGDQAIASVGCAHLIFRTSWVYGANGNNFMRTMLRLAREREALSIVDDQIGAPTWSRLIAEVTTLALARCWRPGDTGALAERNGVYHLTPTGQISWYGFAKAILQADPHREEQVLKELKPIPTSEYPTPAKRPSNSRLDCSKLKEVFALHLPTWEAGLKGALGV